MLLRLYYLYKKSPKKCRELEDVVSALKSCLEPHKVPEKGGNIPLCACGTRWVSHKLVAISRFLERYGACIAHLITLTEDPAVKSPDKQKMKGYILQWSDAKMVWLVLVELLFCLPIANGLVERMFSTLKIIKTDKRSCLGEDTLDDLMRISVDGPPLAQWTAKPAVELWWKGKARRSVQDERAPPRPTCSTSVSATQYEPYTLDINEWDSFLDV